MIMKVIIIPFVLEFLMVLIIISMIMIIKYSVGETASTVLLVGRAWISCRRPPNSFPTPPKSENSKKVPPIIIRFLLNPSRGSLPHFRVHAKPHSLGVPPRSWAPWSYPGGGEGRGGREGGGEGAGRGESDTGPHPLRLPKDRPPHMNVWRPIG